MIRVRIRPATSDDLPLIEPWYAEASAAVDGVREPAPPGELQRRFDRSDGGLLVIERTSDPTPIGLLEHHAAESGTEIKFLAMAAGQRGWGYGSEAVMWLEEQRRSSRYIVRIGARNGLAVYFWRLLGYRPAHAGSAVWLGSERQDMIAMVRDVCEAPKVAPAGATITR